MTELIATEFDGGSPPHVNWKIFEEGEEARYEDLIRIVKRQDGTNRWSISNNSGKCLNKSGEWTYDVWLGYDKFTEKDTYFIAGETREKSAVRWETPEEAMAFLENWKKEELQRAIDKQPELEEQRKQKEKEEKERARLEEERRNLGWLGLFSILFFGRS